MRVLQSSSFSLSESFISSHTIYVFFKSNFDFQTSTTNTIVIHVNKHLCPCELVKKVCKRPLVWAKMVISGPISKCFGLILSTQGLKKSPQKWEIHHQQKNIPGCNFNMPSDSHGSRNSTITILQVKRVCTHCGTSCPNAYTTSQIKTLKRSPNTSFLLRYGVHIRDGKYLNWCTPF